MKSLKEYLQTIFSPDNTPSLIEEKNFSQLRAVLPIQIFLDMLDAVDEIGKKELLQFLKKPSIVITHGIIFMKTGTISLEGRLRELIYLYTKHLEESLGSKSLLINLYRRISIVDIVNLIDNHVIFVLRERVTNKNRKELAAIRYLEPYDIFFEDRVYRMPGCIIAIRIDKNFTLGNPEIISLDGQKYEHPFVYLDNYILGQKVCMGSYEKSHDKRIFNNFSLGTHINHLIKQVIQILTTGYSRQVAPANGHLTTPKYNKYLKEIKK